MPNHFERYQFPPGHIEKPNGFDHNIGVLPPVVAPKRNKIGLLVCGGPS